MSRQDKQRSALTGSIEERRAVMSDAIASASTVLPLFESIAVEDRRPREAIDGAGAWLRGELSIGEARALAVAAHAAARSVGDDAARAAARAAGHAVATAHMAGHARRAAEYSSKARKLAGLDEE